MYFFQVRRDSKAAKRFFNRLIISNQGKPRKIVTYKLGSYRVAHRDLIPDMIHDTSQYANNRAELSHQPTRENEECVSLNQLNRHNDFLSTHTEVYNLFNLGRHLISAKNDRLFRDHASRLGKMQ